MSVSIALAGKPNTGKSTFFKAATLVDVEIANYPFTTISANRGCRMCAFRALALSAAPGAVIVLMESDLSLLSWLT